MKEFKTISHLEILKRAFSDVVGRWLYYGEKSLNNPDDEILKERVQYFNSIRLELGEEIERMKSVS